MISKIKIEIKVKLLFLSSLMRTKSNDFDLRMAYIVNLYVILGISSLVSNHLLHVCFNTAAERQIRRIRNKFYKSIIRQDTSFFDKNTSGELTAVLNV